MSTNNLLVELGTEELPPKALKQLAQAFADNFGKQLQQAHLAYQEIKWFASPRRLALTVANLATQQPDLTIEKKGPSVKVAFDANGEPTKALSGWLNSCGISLEQTETVHTDKGDWLIYHSTQAGKASKEILVELINNALTSLPITKPMHWADKEVFFVRPVHTVTVLLDDQLLAGEILGIKIDRIIRGHRFMGEQQFTINHAIEYPKILREKGSVIADFVERQAIIKADAERMAAEINGIVDLEADLLDEVTSLVEYPVVMMAKFEERFLQVPAEALVSTMKADQKYFPIYDQQHNLLPYFLFVANIDPVDPSQIIQGNEKVVRPRLSDAEFFFKTDLKHKLEDYLPRLDTVLFEKQLGTLLDKTKRLEVLSGIIAQQLKVDETLAKRAALLSKCDLMTNMVFEFTDTQGIMGMHYARHAGEDEQVAVAINQQYMPRFAGDQLPTSLIACCLAVADKIDTLVGIFGIGQAPKGDKDPFALRRAALGVIRIIIEKQLDLDLACLLEQAIDLYAEKLTNTTVKDDVLAFILARCPAFYQEQGFSHDEIQAVLSLAPTKPLDFDARIRAVAEFKKIPAATELAAANKRVSNILAKNSETLSANVKLELAENTTEKDLINKVNELQTKLVPIVAQHDYQQALTLLAELRTPIDNFFEQVIVNAEQADIRINRLSLLQIIRNMFLQVADISVLVEIKIK